MVLVPIESGLSGEASSPLGFCVDSWTSNGIYFAGFFQQLSSESWGISTYQHYQSKPTTGSLYKNHILNTSRNINSLGHDIIPNSWGIWASPPFSWVSWALQFLLGSTIDRSKFLATNTTVDAPHRSTVSSVLVLQCLRFPTLTNTWSNCTLQCITTQSQGSCVLMTKSEQFRVAGFKGVLRVNLRFGHRSF